MAENTISARTYDQQPVAEYQNTDAADCYERVDRDSYSFGSCYRTRDINQLLDIFIADIRKMMPCDGIEYSEDTLGLYYVDGVLSQHRCNYTIRLGDQTLGKICFSRQEQYLESDLAMIENLVAGLVRPLRNALQYEQAIRFALRDELTGLKNGIAYYDNIAVEIERARRYKAPFSLLLINLDDFSEINQAHGQDAGDAVLVEMAGRLEKYARKSDIIFRKGGDEFLVFLPNTGNDAARVVAERIKNSVLSAPCIVGSIEILFTMSIGVVSVLPNDSAFTLIDRADKALYHAKILGKNRIQGATAHSVRFQE